MKQKSETRSDDRPAGVPSPDPMLLTETAIVAGITGGTAVGAIGGPVGAAIGAAVGATIGALAGSALTNEERRLSRHDHELDDAIGVTQGTLGRDDVAAGDDPAALAGVLQSQHRVLDAAMALAIDACRRQAWTDATAAITAVGRAFARHAVTEERALRRETSAEIAALDREHQELSARLEALAADISLETVDMEAVDVLRGQLERHLLHEERVLRTV